MNNTFKLNHTRIERRRISFEKEKVRFRDSDTYFGILKQFCNLNLK